MSRVIELLWLAPALPLAAAAFIALLPRRMRVLAAGTAIASVAGALIVSCVAFLSVLKGVTGIHTLRWFAMGEQWVELGWILNPMTAVMLAMVSFVSLLIFIYSVGYMRHDANFTRFFCFLAFFAAAMLGVVIANSLLLLFICWELVGLASYLLIGFWYQKPAAAAAAKKAFVVTRIGDLAFLLGMVWLFSKTGTLLLYNSGEGCIEGKALAALAVQSFGPLGLTTAIGLLIFAGAVGKSGQVPLHVWLPDAMEGPTPVSALIHAATMVAAGVFLVARVYPLMAAPSYAATSALPQIHESAPAAPAQVISLSDPHLASPTLTLKVITWTGVLTALFAASIAVAQTDIKRILAYSTVSQLGFMMAGFGTGGVAVGMFHLITHAFFKALLFLGAGSVIHGSHDEQDIRRMGNLRKFMPVTFATYAVGMLALSGFPLLFSGFWSKDAILHAARHWEASHLPFYLLLLAAFLTAFYMTRQMCFVFFGEKCPSGTGAWHEYPPPHESGPVMLLPLLTLGLVTVLLVLVGTPVWPWFDSFISGDKAHFDFSRFTASGTLPILAISSVVAVIGIGLGILLYLRSPARGDEALRMRWPQTHGALAKGYYVDEIYEHAFVAAARGFSRFANWLDRTIITGAVEVVGLLSAGLAWISRFADEFLVNKGFDEGCSGLKKGGGFFSGWQSAHPQTYLRIGAAGVIFLGLLLLWGCR